MEIRYSPNQIDYTKLNTQELRIAFLIENLFAPGKIDLVYTDADRAIVGSAVPTGSTLKLTADAELRAAYFCERRELGVLNIGGDGAIEVDGKRYEMGKLDCLYVGRGSQEVSFSSKDASNPAAFYLLSYPAHAAYPTTHARVKDATPVELGTVADANRRTIYKYIHTGGIKSCQLVMGFTKLEEGSVWNTMPPHTHTRRSEIYIYFDMDPNQRVMHFMGTPQQTRHLVVANRQVVISPSWSIHCGCGTRAYTFCWAMGGENQTFEDMDPAPVEELR
ncbi:MAG TPA: 5-dehydro-4-deoxy-D-glucuronate isomerase [Verrucomicrobia bacterium]|nr:5-dehydro-4-deoxy-D-glucuronate isomerase [Verrucomicrobiota bacterium]HOP95924.1 5-dehydro-4-deoxy-D-glucuronate isomerase [Verrucomicrobiota bacterium]HPU57601.1 5-dehydro-4-deoxy-D-glucuronate isomerase [Verrucomicrobiota bacterium]